MQSRHAQLQLLWRCLAQADRSGSACTSQQLRLLSSAAGPLHALQPQAPQTGLALMQARALATAAAAEAGEDPSRGKELVDQARKNTKFWARYSIVGVWPMFAQSHATTYIKAP